MLESANRKPGRSAGLVMCGAAWLTRGDCSGGPSRAIQVDSAVAIEWGSGVVVGVASVLAIGVDGAVVIGAGSGCAIADGSVFEIALSCGTARRGGSCVAAVLSMPAIFPYADPVPTCCNGASMAVSAGRLFACAIGGRETPGCADAACAMRPASLAVMTAFSSGGRIFGHGGCDACCWPGRSESSMSSQV